MRRRAPSVLLPRTLMGLFLVGEARREEVEVEVEEEEWPFWRGGREGWEGEVQVSIKRLM